MMRPPLLRVTDVMELDDAQVATVDFAGRAAHARFRRRVIFPLQKDGGPLLGASDRIAELVVRIHDMEGRVESTVPVSLLEPGPSLGRHSRLSFQ